MKPEITNQGVEIQTFQEIFDELVAGFKDIYGADIDLDPESPDGQRVGIYATKIHDLQTFGMAVANNLDPDLSVGLWQEMLLKFSGITKRPPIRSQVDVEITTDRNLTLEEGYTVADSVGTRWKLDTEATLQSGTSTVTLFAEDFGPIEAAANTVTDPETIILGVTNVSNPAAAEVGQDEETEAEVRRRRRLSIETPAFSTRGSLFGRLFDIVGVTDLQVYENDTNSVDSRGVPAHGLWCVVQGGDVADIIETIVKNKTGGTDLKGDIEEVFVEEKDGFNINLVARFDRPTFTDVEVRLDATRKDSADPVDTQAIEDAIAAEEFLIAENILANQLYGPVFKAGDNFIATNLQVRRKNAGENWTEGRIEADPDEVLQIDAADVAVTEITP